MNTGSRMESTGLGNRIQISNGMSLLNFFVLERNISRQYSQNVSNSVPLSTETAELLIGHGKSKWLTPREDVVLAKGKGALKTYWLKITSRSDRGESQAETSTGASSERDRDDAHFNDEASNGKSANEKNFKESRQYQQLSSNKTKRLIEWNVDVLKRLLKEVVARRQATMDRKQKSQTEIYQPEMEHNQEAGKTVIDEVVEIIHLPKYNAKSTVDPEQLDTAELLGDQVCDQLRTYVASVAALYRDNVSSGRFDLNFDTASCLAVCISL